MVFMCGLPLLFGILCTRTTPYWRIWIISTGVLASAIFVLVYPDSDLLVAPAQEQLAFAQSNQTRRVYANEGSGVVFDDGGNPWGALIPKLLYTLLAPFPWTEGSTALQLAKIETIIWYFMLYWAVRGALQLWRYDRKILLILLLFIVPGTIAYATSMANIGLIFRQRIPIAMITSLLSALAWSGKEMLADTGKGLSNSSRSFVHPAGRR
jgi:hypothetical protein